MRNGWKWKNIAGGGATAADLAEERLRRYPPKPLRGGGGQETAVRFDNGISPDYTVVEIEAPDRPGLLYRIAAVFSACRVNIVSARLSTRIDRAADVFYVLDNDGGKITAEEPQRALESAVRDAVNRR